MTDLMDSLVSQDFAVFAVGRFDALDGLNETHLTELTHWIGLDKNRLAELTSFEFTLWCFRVFFTSLVSKSQSP